jgi:hypothetical protein
MGKSFLSTPTVRRPAFWSRAQLNLNLLPSQHHSGRDPEKMQFQGNVIE